MKNKFLNFLIIGILVIGITGCGNSNQKELNDIFHKDKEEIDETQSNSKDKEEQKEKVKEEVKEKVKEESKKRNNGVDVDLYGYDYFVDKTARLLAFNNGKLPEGKHFIDENLNILFTYNFNMEYDEGEYSKALTKDKDGNINVYYKDGSVVFSYKENEYKKVVLTSHGYLIINKVEETYNNSVEKIGVYSIKDKKYIIEPSIEYNVIDNYGDDMYILNYEKNIFFNSRLAKIVKYDTSLYDKFVDGYSIEEENYNIRICKDDGNCKKVKYNYDNSYLRTKDYVSNGYAVDTDNGREHVFRIINLSSGEVVDLSNKFYRITNKPLFSKKGYALVLSSNQNGSRYYTVINTKGEMQFEPVKYSSAYSFEGNYDETLNTINMVTNLSNGYIILDGNGNLPSEIRDVNNKLILKSNEGERFAAVINDNIIVVSHNKAIAEYHFSDFKGNRLLVYPKNS